MVLQQEFPVKMGGFLSEECQSVHFVPLVGSVVTELQRPSFVFLVPMLQLDRCSAFVVRGAHSVHFQERHIQSPVQQAHFRQKMQQNVPVAQLEIFVHPLILIQFHVSMVLGHLKIQQFAGHVRLDFDAHKWMRLSRSHASQGFTLLLHNPCVRPVHLASSAPRALTVAILARWEHFLSVSPNPTLEFETESLL